MICKHCGGEVEVRNPSGFCDHLHYPENCEICNAQNEKKRCLEEAAPVMLAALKTIVSYIPQLWGDHVVNGCISINTNDDAVDQLFAAIKIAEGK